jgi:hypothetical protein
MSAAFASVPLAGLRSAGSQGVPKAPGLGRKPRHTGRAEPRPWSSPSQTGIGLELLMMSGGQRSILSGASMTVETLVPLPPSLHIWIPGHLRLRWLRAFARTRCEFGVRSNPTVSRSRATCRGTSSRPTSVTKCMALNVSECRDKMGNEIKAVLFDSGSTLLRPIGGAWGPRRPTEDA